MKAIIRDWSNGDLSLDTTLPVYDGLYVGTGGTNLSLTSRNGNTAVFKNIPDSELFPASPDKINTTGSDCANIIGTLFNE